MGYMIIRQHDLYRKIYDFEFIVTGSEKEALLLEINLIKKNHPPL